MKLSVVFQIPRGPHFMLTVHLQSLELPLSKEEINKLPELLHSEPLLERMVERAVRGMRKSELRARRTTRST